ncbi:reprolysin-like metallopeptidase [Faecalibacter macacae]|uniref:T9SS C-terminal target domain-containing protein n=1 Tax=Faecalibacter macacae TaxID=1859289 RepID=A0A3L9ML20_9FLAO|nr:zinc-dependent metalloprotease family protein [Faecalibacter macacae]RLZ11954.1 T9SS C-terminal target domain-containing protein [Faecalibacter macacae]
MKSKFIILSLLLGSSSIFAQKNHWQEIKNANFKPTNLIERITIPKEHKLFTLDTENLKKELNQTSNKGANQPRLVSIPNGDGQIIKYLVEESSIMAPNLQDKYDMVRSYVGKSQDGKHSIRFSFSPYHGLSAMIFQSDKVSYIEAYTEDLNTYISYNRKSVESTHDFICDTENIHQENIIKQAIENIPTNRTAVDGQLRKYRLALATTVEYSRYHFNRAGLAGGTDEEKVAAVMSAINVAMTRVNGIYEKEFGVTMELIDNNDKLIFIRTDEYTNNSGSAMLGENQTVIDREIGIDNYDIGHVFSTGGGGVAYLRSPCGYLKAGGVTGLSAPINDVFYIDFVAHEMGHQFGATHTFNNSCSGNRSTATAIEPGSGSTIMAYAGICPPNVQNNSDPYFSTASVNNIYSFITSNAGQCSVNTESGNNEPEIDLNKLSYHIPHSTAFKLDAIATDVDGDNLTYSWEQTDNQTSTQTAVQPPISTNTGGPTFRSIIPTTESERYFPNFQSILANKLTLATNPAPFTWEVLPSVARRLNFSLLVRDNNPVGGQTARKNVTISVKEVGPFQVTSQENSETWTGGQEATISWDVAGTDANNINTTDVKIILSLDGGITWDYTLVESTPNNGTYTFIVPHGIGETTNARLMILPIDNIYLAVNKVNFTINSPLSIIEVNDNNAITITPNPSRGEVNIETAKNYSNFIAYVNDMTGKQVYNYNTARADVKSHKLNLSHLPNGVYIVTVKADGEQYSKKLVIKK